MLDKIKKLCSNRGISIPELEKACGLGSRTVYKWDAINPSIDKVKAVADYFGCTIDSLVNEPIKEGE